MTLWEWWAGDAENVDCEGCYESGPHPTREAAIAAGRDEKWGGDYFSIIEARSSSASKHDELEVVPFLRTRNFELIDNDPSSSDEKAGA